MIRFHVSDVGKISVVKILRQPDAAVEFNRRARKRSNAPTRDRFSSLAGNLNDNSHGQVEGLDRRRLV